MTSCFQNFHPFITENKIVVWGEVLPAPLFFSNDSPAGGGGWVISVDIYSWKYSNMFDVDVITNRLKGAVKSILDTSNSADEFASIIETDFEHEDNKSKLGEFFCLLSTVCP